MSFGHIYLVFICTKVQEAIVFTQLLAFALGSIFKVLRQSVFLELGKALSGEL